MCIIIKGLTEEQYRKLIIWRKLDYAVIYPGTLKTNDMKAKSITNSWHLKKFTEALYICVLMYNLHILEYYK